MSKSWRNFADWAKHQPAVLRLADQLGRSRGRLRLLDDLHPPPPAPRKPSLQTWESQSLAAIWIGHATVLLRINGKTILTDPVFSSRVGLGLGMLTIGPKRWLAPAMSIGELPPIDLILISHAHFDHLDRPSLVKLPRRTPVVTASNTSDLLLDLGYRNVTELKWGQSFRMDSLEVTATSVKHWGARTFYDLHRGYNGYVLRSADHRVLYAGDTAYHEEFVKQHPVDLAILGIAAYDPYIAAHATPEQAWQMAGHARARFVLPIHHSTFRLSHEPMDEPLQRLLKAAGEPADRIIIREIGGQWGIP